MYYKLVVYGVDQNAAVPDVENAADDEKHDWRSLGDRVIDTLLTIPQKPTTDMRMITIEIGNSYHDINDSLVMYVLSKISYCLSDTYAE